MTREKCIRWVEQMYHFTGFRGNTTFAPDVVGIYKAVEAQNATGQIGQTIGHAIHRKRVRNVGI